MQKNIPPKTRVIGARCNDKLIVNAKKKLRIDSNSELVRYCLKLALENEPKPNYLWQFGKKRLIGEITRLTALNNVLTKVNEDLTSNNTSLKDDNEYIKNECNKLINKKKTKHRKQNKSTLRIKFLENEIARYKRLNNKLSSENSRILDWKQKHAVVFIQIDKESWDVLHIPMYFEEYQNWKNNIPGLLDHLNLPAKNPCFFIHIQELEE